MTSIKPCVDVLDLASELDLQRMERLMSMHKDHSIEVIYSPYILLVWEDQFKSIHLAYFERQSQKDMKLAEEIMNSSKVIHKDMSVKFPFAFLRWNE